MPPIDPSVNTIRMSITIKRIVSTELLLSLSPFLANSAFSASLYMHGLIVPSEHLEK